VKYVLLVHRPTEAPADDDPVEEMRAYARLKADLEAEGVWLGGQALYDRSFTTQVQVRDGDALVVDGPLAETAEQIAGYYLLDCDHLDEVIAIAARVPAALHGTIEIRPVWDYENELDNLG
jgi:hypothetical protein